MNEDLTDKPCCTICDAKKTCHICGQQTLMACSDCRIDFGISIYVCNKPECQKKHESKCPNSFLAERDELVKLLKRNLERMKLINGDDCGKEFCPNHLLIKETEQALSKATPQRKEK